MQHKVSLIVPVYNEAGAIEPFVSAVEAVTTTLDAELDILFVDDGSRNSTCGEIAAAAKTHAIPIQLLALSRNFGKEAALTAGLDAAAGDAVSQWTWICSTRRKSFRCSSWNGVGEARSFMAGG